MEYILEEMDTTEFSRVLDKTPFLAECVKTHLVGQFGIIRSKNLEGCGEDGEVQIERITFMLFRLVEILRLVKFDAKTHIFPRIQHGQ